MLTKIKSSGIKVLALSAIVQLFFALLSCAVYSQIKLTVREKSGINRNDEMIRNGIPLAKNSGISDPSNFHIEDVNGNAVNAQFEVLSRWGGRKLGSNPVQWLLVTFPATVNANDSAVFLLKAGPHANSGTLLTTTQNINAVTVNTGTGTFIISKNSFNIFQEAMLNTGINLLGAGPGSATILVEGKPLMTAQKPDEVSIEHAGDLFVMVKVKGKFNNPPYGSESWDYIMRYSFYAGSSTVDLDFYYSFPGNKNGTSAYEAYNKSDLVKVLNAKLVLPLSFTGTPSAYASAEEGQILSGTLAAGQTVSAAQKLRPAMTAPAAYQLTLGSSSKNGTYAEKPFVAVQGNNGGIGVTINKMKFYEPQNITGYPNKFEINVVADSQWVGPFMGAYAKMSLTLQPPGTDWNSVRDTVLGKLDHKIFAWPDQYYAGHAGVLDELWDGTPNTYAQKYLTKTKIITQNTIQGYLTYKMHGFMTYGLTPRYWFYQGTNEFGDQTTWDGYYFGGTFTDYHNNFSNAVRLFAQDGDGELLNHLAFPAARRTLNTQILQDGPNLNPTYAGWAPIGYGGYRKDNNSSHSYFENLYFYYYLTGDQRVLDVLTKAGDVYRKSYSRYADNSLVPTPLAPKDSWRKTIGRPSSQMAALVWFLAHASNDSSFFDDYKNQYGRLADRHLALLKKNGVEYAFMTDDSLRHNPLSLTTEQVWMLGLYTMQNLWWLYNEFGDLQLGTDNIAISRIFSAYERTCWEYYAKVYAGGDGTVAGKWSNKIDVSWSGTRIGGIIQNVTAVTAGSDPFLYLHGKSNQSVSLFRAAYMNQDMSMYDRAVTLTQYVIDNTNSNRAWDKSSSLEWVRLHPAVYWLVNGISNPTFVNTPSEITNTLQTYPNPFCEESIIIYSLEKPAAVSLEIFDVSGKRVALLVNTKQEKGKHEYQISSQDYSLHPGIYFVKLSLDNTEYSNRLIRVN